MQPAGLLWLSKRAAESQKIVEVGCFVGKSTRVLAHHCPGTVFAVDAWDENNPGLTRLPPGSVPPVVGPGDGTRLKAEFYRNLAQEIREGKVKPLQGCSVDVVRTFAAGSVDLVFLDANHFCEDVKADISAWRPKVRKGGILSGHDYGVQAHPGVRQAVDELVPDATIDRGSSIWWATL